MIDHSRPRTIRVLSVDDNELIGEAMAVEFAFIDDMEWVGQRPCADGLADAVAELRPDVVLLDIDMPGADPFAAIRETVRLFPQTRVLMLTGHVRGDLIDRAVEAGAWGYISKSEPVPTIFAAIRQAARGEFVISPLAAAYHSER